MKVKEIIIHCSATPNFRHHTAEEIHQWHLERGWDGIGYHYVIPLHGVLEKGRPEYWTGAHASGHNANSIGICLIGTDQFTAVQWHTLTLLVKDLKNRHPNARVIGHNEVSNKTCPGFDVQQWLREYKI